MKSFKRILALFLVLTMCFSLLPLSVFAEELKDELPEESVLNEDLLEEVPQEPAVEDEEGASAVCEHNYIAVVTEPTDTEGGYTTFICSLCGDSYVADYTEALLPPAEEEVEAELEEDTEADGEIDAEEEQWGVQSQEEDGTLEAQNVDSSVIVGFAEPEEIFTDYKMALVTLQERFPVQLAVSFGGTVFYAQDEAGELLIDHTEPERTENLDVVWLCEEDYDEDLEEFHFVPALDNFVLAEGVELPRLVVHVGPGPELPELRPLPKLPELELPIVGSSYRLRGGLPPYYNLYEKGVLPPVRDQGTYGNCWSFATIGSLEADLIHDGVFDTGIDLSELHLVYYTYFPYYDEKGCSDGDNVDASSVDPFDYGGNAHFAFEGLSKMLGPAWEYDVPYTAIDSYRPGPAYGRNDGCSLQMTGAYMMRADDRNAIKQSIMDHGGVCTSVYWNESCYSATHNSYYTSNNSNYVANHAIMLVGWDDSFPASNFTSSNQPQNPGAWLVRNSWGKNAYGKYGYFWLSYEGLYTAEAAELDEENNVSQKLAFAFDAQSGQYDHCYAFDGSPAYVYYKCNSGVTVSQSFTVDAGETIEAVGFETLDPNLQLQITVSCGGQTYTATKATQYAGFYLIPIDEIEVETQAAVTVSVKLSGSGTIQVPVESSYNYGDIVYTASCGSGGLLLDNFNTRADGRVKLFTTDSLYTITYDANGGTGAPAAQSKPYGAALTLSSMVPTREGYIFLGWATSRTATEAQYQPGASYTTEGDATLYAVWQPKTYLITYDANGGMGAPSAQTKTHGTALTLSGTAPTREGYDFVGWATSKTATEAQYQPGYSYTVEGNATLYAVWQQRTYSVVYDANGGTGAPAAQTKTHGTALILSSMVPTREGYIFLGWATSRTATEAQYQPGASYTTEGSILLYAVWKHKIYTISYDANGGTGAPAMQTKTHGTALTLSSTAPTREGYKFLGWATRADAKEAAYKSGASYTAEGNAILYAVWSLLLPVEQLDIDREYLALMAGKTATLTLTNLPADWATFVTWTSDKPSAATVDDFGKVTAEGEGTAWITASVSAGESMLFARCRVDVVAGEVASEVTGVRLLDTKATVELYKTDYTRITMIPELSQNSIDAAAPTILTPDEDPVLGTGVAVQSARLAEVKPDARHAKAEEVFLLSVVDDRTLEIIPKAEYITSDAAKLKALKGSYKATVYVTVDGREFEAGVLTLTVKKTLPKLTAKALKLNSCYADTQSVIFTGSVPVCKDDYDGGWFFFDKASRTITYTGPLNVKQAAYKLTLPVKVEGWAVEMPVTLSVSAAPAAPKLTVKAVGTIDLGVKGSAVTLVPTLKNDSGQADLSVTKITDAKGTEASGLFGISGLAITAGETVPAGKYKATVTATIPGAAPVSATVQFTVKAPAKAAAPTVTLKATGFIDVIRPESAVTITPTVKDLQGVVLKATDLTITRNSDGKTGLFDVTVVNGKYVVTARPDAGVSSLDKYTVRATVAGVSAAKPIALPVKMGTAKVTQSAKSVTLLETDRNSQATVKLSVADGTLSAIDWTRTETAFAAQNAGKAFSFKHLGNGECVIGYTDNELPTAPKAGTVKIPVFFTGNLSTKPNATLSVSVKLK